MVSTSLICEVFKWLWAEGTVWLDVYVHHTVLINLVLENTDVPVLNFIADFTFNPDVKRGGKSLKPTRVCGIVSINRMDRSTTCFSLKASSIAVVLCMMKTCIVVWKLQAFRIDWSFCTMNSADNVPPQCRVFGKHKEISLYFWGVFKCIRFSP